jgi:hypothetical protein
MQNKWHVCKGGQRRPRKDNPDLVTGIPQSLHKGWGFEIHNQGATMSTRLFVFLKEDVARRFIAMTLRRNQGTCALVL